MPQVADAPDLSGVDGKLAALIAVTSEAWFSLGRALGYRQGYEQGMADGKHEARIAVQKIITAPLWSAETKL